MTASIPRRIAAWFLDYLVVMVPGLAVVLFAMGMLLQTLPAYLGGIAAGAGWSFLFRIFTGGAGAEFSAGWIGFAAPLIAALLFVPLLQFVYQAIMLSWRGRTFGKMVLDIRVTAAAGGPEAVRPSRGSALGRAFLTTTLETGLLGIALVLLTIGQFLLATLLWLGATAAFWLNAFTLLGPARRTLVDRLAGTAVQHRGLYAEVAGRAAALAQRGSAAIRAGLRPAPAISAQGAIIEGQAVPAGGFQHRTAQPPAIEQHPAGAWQQQQQVFAPLPPAVDPFAAYEQQQTQVVKPPTLPLPIVDQDPPQVVAPQVVAPQVVMPSVRPADDPETVATEVVATEVVATQPIAPSPVVAPRTVSDTRVDLERVPAVDFPQGNVTADDGGARSIRDYPAAILHSDPVQRAINSRAGQQAQAFGVAGAEKAQQLGEQAAARARRLGSRAQELWRQRQANRAQEQAPGQDPASPGE